jgi:hypothetical protein
VTQLTGRFSLMIGGDCGRVIGIIAAGIGALESLLSVGGAHPFWSLGIFALCLWILHGLVVYGADGTPQTHRHPGGAYRPFAASRELPASGARQSPISSC